LGFFCEHIVYNYSIAYIRLFYSKKASKNCVIPISTIPKNIATKATVVITVIVYVTSSFPFGQLTFLISLATSFKNFTGFTSIPPTVDFFTLFLYALYVCHNAYKISLFLGAQVLCAYF